LQGSCNDVFGDDCDDLLMGLLIHYKLYVFENDNDYIVDQIITLYGQKFPLYTPSNYESQLLDPLNALGG
jgi:hypothetical protein